MNVCHRRIWTFECLSFQTCFRRDWSLVDTEADKISSTRYKPCSWENESNLIYSDVYSFLYCTSTRIIFDRERSVSLFIHVFYVLVRTAVLQISYGCSTEEIKQNSILPSERSSRSSKKTSLNIPCWICFDTNHERGNEYLIDPWLSHNSNALSKRVYSSLILYDFWM